MRRLIAVMLLVMVCFCSCTSDAANDASSSSKADKTSSVASKVESTEVSSKVESTEVSSKEPVDPAVNDYPKRTYAVLDILDYLKLDGRYRQGEDDHGNKGITYDNAYNCISFVADCEGDITIDLGIMLYNDEKEGWDERYFTVYIDGVRQDKRIAAKGGLSTYSKSTITVAKDLKKGKHTIEVYRQNEAKHCAMLLKSITMNGVLCERPKDRDLLIEFVGDSITAGYGNLLYGDGENPGHAKNSDATSTYAFITAKNLNADITATCRSGHMFSGTNPLFSDFYNQINWIKDKSIYTPTRHPDVIVINLGTNDENKGDISTLTEYTVKALETVRAVHPDSKIVWAYGMGGTDIKGKITKGIKEFGGEAKGVYFCALPTDHSGGNYHPSLSGHKKAADVLTKFIKDNVL